MKQMISFALVLVMIFCAIPNAVAQETTTNVISETVQYLDDGTSVTITVTEEVPIVSVAVTGYTKTGSKTITSTNASGDVNFTFTVTGTFVVNEGVVSACTTARYSYTTPASTWSLQSGNAAKTGNQAVGSGTFIKKLLGVTVDTEEVTVTLTCNKYGVLS